MAKNFYFDSVKSVLIIWPFVLSSENFSSKTAAFISESLTIASISACDRWTVYKQCSFIKAHIKMKVKVDCARVQATVAHRLQRMPQVRLRQWSPLAASANAVTRTAVLPTTAVLSAETLSIATSFSRSKSV